MELIFLLLMILYLLFRPNIDITVNRDVLLWYKPLFNKKRDFILLFNLDEWKE